MDQRETREDGAPPSIKAHRPAPGASAVSFKSDESIGRWINFKREHGPEIHQKHPPSEPGPICESLRSDMSMDHPLNFATEPVEQQGPEVSSGQHHQTQLDSIFKLLEEDIFTFVQKELKKLHKVLSTDYPECLEPEEDEEQRSSSEAVLKITLNFLRRMKQKELAERLRSRSYFGIHLRKLKSNLQQKFECVFEGIAKAGNPTLLNQIYTELYITEGGSSEVNQEHEVRHMETASRKPDPAETPITCEDMFKGPAHTHGPIRTVLTKGVAGIGKTVLTQKFSLDWAEGKANQDIQLLFPFTFRALNVLKERSFSLVTLVHHFFSQTQTELCSFEHLQVLFIFDGLDECRLPLDFTKTKALTDPTESASVHVLLVNLIRGSLLPSARLWITTRPAAANQIPAECISMVTEVRGFTDPQKEQYFRKRFKDKADTIISHIKMSRSLHIMCYMPIFCWIAATVLEHVLKSRERGELPKTLTQMYIHFLVVQAKVKNIKYEEGSETDPHWSPETRKMVKSLGKLAFEQLQKGNLIFYEHDLSECGLDAAAASVYSGVFTQVFREEPGLYQDKVYGFIHLSVQEFLAALHVHQTFMNKGINLLVEKRSAISLLKNHKIYKDLLKFYQTAVDQALQSPNGHLDLLLRFLLGLSLSTNQSLLQGLLKETGSCSLTNQETAEYIKTKLSEDVSAERSINLLHCLNELNDRSLVKQIQQYLSSGRLSEDELSPAQWSALAFILLSSEEDLEQFELTKYSSSEEAFLRLLPVVKASNKALLSGCNLSEKSYDALSSVLSSQSSSLRVLDLSLNDLKDSELEMLSVGLRSPHCKLEQLRLRQCDLSESSCDALSSVLSSQSSSLRVVDLSFNDLKDSGLKMLSVGLKSPHCKLDQLSLSLCGLSPHSCGPLASVLSSSSLTHLDLSHNDLQDSGVELLCSGLKSAPCRLETLRLSGCLVSQRGGAALASALSSAPSHLRELDLSYNHPGPSAELLTALQDQRPLLSVRLSPAGERWMNPIWRYFCDLTLDPNTAHRKLKLSDNNKKVTCVTEEQPYPDHQDRFEIRPQILCSTGLTGRCYWEVQWRGDVCISVSYRGIRRKGDSDDSEFGGNDQSWSLECSAGGFSVYHNNKRTSLPQSCPSSSGTVSVFVDCPAGSLSFYTVSSDQLTHLHTFNTTFTHTLIPGFEVWSENSSVSLCPTDSPSSV
ncbi:NLR family CARD domain-containing protein 3-like [Periophthalmus magnuspinnatus]|uniref:NLR family CARD domain-containing protein 3-like n=1 Tax=Periophthalmus magnuspinnatus TaxID=409849 RepID=UPI002436FA12|nr:NLR family CARD domain-containing protein 3-like [Periophthalmus magnuspinnatus]